MHEKPKRGQPLYQETGDWTQAPPTLQFLNFIDQADDNYADYRNMNVYGLDDTFSWFVEGLGGSHDFKFGTQYQLGEHYREDQRVTNGRFIFPSDRPFNAADPSTYPERLQVRVPQMVKLLSRTHSLGLYLQDKWQMRQNLTLSLGVRYDVHNSPITERWNPFFADPDTHPIDKNNFQPRVGFAYSLGPATVIRGGYGLFYEKQWIDRFENYMLNPVFTNSFIANFPVSHVDPGPQAGTASRPTRCSSTGRRLNRALVNQAVPPGTLARNTGTVWLDTPDRILPYQHQASIGYERQLGRQLAFAADYVHMVNRDLPLRYNLNPGIKPNTGRTTPITRTDLQGIAGQIGVTPFSNDVWIVEYIGETTYDGLNLQNREAVLQQLGRAVLVRARPRPRQHQRHADRHQRFSGAGRAQPGVERRPDQPGPAAHGDGERAIRSPVDPRPDGRRGGAHDDAGSRSPSTTAMSTRTATASSSIRFRRGPTAASARTRSRSRTRAGATARSVRDRCKSTCAPATACGRSAGRTSTSSSRRSTSRTSRTSPIRPATCGRPRSWCRPRWPAAGSRGSSRWARGSGSDR